MIDPDEIPPALWKEMNISRERFDEIQRMQAAREQNAPPLQSVAPDFELRLLVEKGKLSEERVRLSSLRGRPVGLVLGNYT
jgi:hypothetical protein